MVALEVLGALERCPTFTVPLDLDAIPELVAAMEACLAANEDPADDVPELRARLADADARGEALARNPGEIVASRSWRLTWPLRTAATAARRARRRRTAA